MVRKRFITSSFVPFLGMRNVFVGISTVDRHSVTSFYVMWVVGGYRVHASGSETCSVRKRTERAESMLENDLRNPG